MWAGLSAPAAPSGQAARFAFRNVHNGWGSYQFDPGSWLCKPRHQRSIMSINMPCSGPQVWCGSTMLPKFARQFLVLHRGSFGRDTRQEEHCSVTPKGTSQFHFADKRRSMRGKPPPPKGISVDELLSRSAPHVFQASLAKPKTARGVGAAQATHPSASRRAKRGR
jgi:hypothetical protein